VFRSPIGTAVFSVEVLYAGMEFEAPALIFTLIASVVAYASIGLSTGWEPLFHVPPSLAVTRPIDYVWYALLGIAAGIVAAAIPSIFYGMRDLFRRLPIPQALKPAVGGLGVGLLALPLPQVLGGGYEWIQSAMNGQLAVATLAVLLVGKTLAFSLTISSGGSGGVFAPTLYVGAMLGGLLAQFSEQPASAFAVIGMAAVFAGAARVPIASLLMVTEMTAGYHLLAPAGLAVASSYLIQRALSSELLYRSLYEAQVASPVESPAHHERFLRDAFHLLTLRGVKLPSGLDHLQLIPLLRARVPLDLPDGKQLLLGSLAPGSSWVDRSVSERIVESPEAELIAVLRGDRLYLPESDLTLEAEDRLLFLASPGEWDHIRQHLEGQGPAI
jgi:CIC family chloride channel protein